MIRFDKWSLITSHVRLGRSRIFMKHFMLSASDSLVPSAKRTSVRLRLRSRSSCTATRLLSPRGTRLREKLCFHKPLRGRGHLLL